MMSEKELNELLLTIEPLYRERVKGLLVSKRQKVYQLGQKSSEYMENWKNLAYKTAVLCALNEEIDKLYQGKMPLHPEHEEELKNSRRKMISEINVYKSKCDELKRDIINLTGKVKELDKELKPYLERAKITPAKIVKPILLIIICLSFAYLLFSNFQSTTAYSILPGINLTNAILGLISLLIVIALGIKYLK